MQYLLIFLAVLVVIVCMNGFLFLAIRQIARRIREQVEGRFIRELSVFDELYEQKVEQLERLREEKALSDSNIFPQGGAKKQEDTLVFTAGMSGGGGDIPVSHTSNPNFSEEYRYVKSAFDMDYEDLVRQVTALSPEPGWNLGALADRFLEMVPEDVAFGMSTLDGEEQLEVLSEVLEPEVKTLLEQYMLEEELEMEAFDILDFLSYMKNISRLYRDEVTVYTGNHNYQTNQSGVHVVCDPSICEGVRIVRGNRLYDYSF